MSREAALLSAICPDCLERLVELYAGRVIRVPSRLAERRRARVKAVQADLDAGMTYRATGDTHQCALSTVVSIAKRL